MWIQRSACPGRGSGLNLPEELAGVPFHLRQPQEEVEGGGAEELAGQVAEHLLAPGAFPAPLEEGHGPLAPGHGADQFPLVHRDPGLLGQELAHLPHWPAT